MGRPRRKVAQVVEDETKQESKTPAKSSVPGPGKVACSGRRVLDSRATRQTDKQAKSVLKTPKSKSKSVRTADAPDAFRSSHFSGILKDDLICSQHLDPGAEVGWDANSPDALRHIQFVSKGKRDQVDGIRDIVKKLAVQTGDGLSCTPPLLGLWMNKEDLKTSPENVRLHRQTRLAARTNHSRASGRQATEFMPDDLMKQLAEFVQEHEVRDEPEIRKSESCGGEDNSKTPRPSTSCMPTPGASCEQGSPVSRRRSHAGKRLDMLSPQPPGQRGHLIDRGQRGHLTDKASESPRLRGSGPHPLADVAAVSEDLWDSDEDDLFNDDSFVLKATQMTEEVFSSVAEQIASPRTSKRHMTSTPEGGKPSKAGRYTFQLPPTQSHNNLALHDLAKLTAQQDSTKLAAAADKKTSASDSVLKQSFPHPFSEPLPINGLTSKNTTLFSQPKTNPVSSNLKKKKVPTAQQKNKQKTASFSQHKNEQKTVPISQQTTVPVYVNVQPKIIPVSINVQHKKSTFSHKITVPVSQKTAAPILQKKIAAVSEPTTAPQTSKLGDKGSRLHIQTGGGHDNSMIPPTAQVQSEDWRDESLTDDILCQLIEPDDVLDSQFVSSDTGGVKTGQFTSSEMGGVKISQLTSLETGSVKTKVKSQTEGNASAGHKNLNSVPAVQEAAKRLSLSSGGKSCPKKAENRHSRQTGSVTTATGSSQASCPMANLQGHLGQKNCKEFISVPSTSKFNGAYVEGAPESDSNKQTMPTCDSVPNTVQSAKSPTISQRVKTKQSKDTEKGADENKGCDQIEDSFFDDDMLAEPEILAMLDEVESQQLSQKASIRKTDESSSHNSTSCQGPVDDQSLQCTPEQIHVKRQEAIRRRRNSQKGKNENDADIMSSQSSGSSQGSIFDDQPLQCTPEHIETKKQEAIRRRQNSQSDIRSEHDPEDVLSQNSISSQVSSDDGPSQCTPDEIAMKKQEALKRRQNRLKMQTKN